MTKKYLKVDVVSPLGSVFKGEADIVSLRGSAGEMGIAYGHTELLSTLPAGVVNVRKDEHTDVLYVSGGIVEVTPTRVTIMVDDMERAENLNQAEAEKLELELRKLLRIQMLPNLIWKLRAKDLVRLMLVLKLLILLKACITQNKTSNSINFQKV